MEGTKRTTLTLRSKPAAKSPKPEVQIVPAVPQAYVAPEPTEQEIDAMPIGQRINYLVGTNVNEWEWLSDHENGLDDYWSDDGQDDYDDGPIDDRATAMYLRDWRRNVAHDPSEGHGVEISGNQDALKQLMIAVVTELNRWKKPPKAEATAKGIGLAIAMVRKEQVLKHPRDLAKEVGVRAQTLHQIKNIALQEIQRLNLAAALAGEEVDEPGTYNQIEEGRNEESGAEDDD